MLLDPLAGMTVGLLCNHGLKYYNDEILIIRNRPGGCFPVQRRGCRAFLGRRSSSWGGRRGSIRSLREPGDLFACATEAFFEQPDKLIEESQNLYNLLKTFFNFDPLKSRRPSKQIVTV